jgi:Domain of unknown function (DUF4190)
MADMAWEHAAEARAALNAIVTDPEHGVDALSNPRTMSNLLKDLLPDAPREKNLLLAAADAGLADSLREHVAQGMDSSTAIRLTSSSFAARSPLTPDACSWVTGEIAAALGISGSSEAVPTPGARDGAGLAEAVPPNMTRVYDEAPPGSTFAAGSTAFIPGSTAYSPGPAGYSLGPAGYSLGPAGYSPAGYPTVPGQQGFGTAPGIGYPPVQVPGLVPGYQPGLAAGQGRRSNTLAVGSLVLGLVQFVGWIFVLPGLVAAILAIVFGFVSMNQIKRSGERGRGLATVGVVLGFLAIIIAGLLVVVGVAAKNQQ